MFVGWKRCIPQESERGKGHSSTVDRLMTDRIFKSQFHLAETRWNQLSCDLTSLRRENHSRHPMILLIILKTGSLASWTIALAQFVSILHQVDRFHHAPALRIELMLSQRDQSAIQNSRIEIGFARRSQSEWSSRVMRINQFRFAKPVSRP